jgi:hypothetical protein
MGACCREERRRKKIEGREAVAERVSATQSGFKHANNGILLGNYLSLPYENDGHDAHGKDAESENNARLRLSCGNVKHAANPFHHGQLLQWEIAQKAISNSPERQSNRWKEGQLRDQKRASVIEPSVRRF